MVIELYTCDEMYRIAMAIADELRVAVTVTRRLNMSAAERYLCQCVCLCRRVIIIHEDTRITAVRGALLNEWSTSECVHAPYDKLLVSSTISFRYVKPVYWTRCRQTGVPTRILYTSLFAAQVETKTYLQTYSKQNRKETQKYLSNK